MKAVPFISLLTCIALISLYQSECSARELDHGPDKLVIVDSNALPDAGGRAFASKAAMDTFYLYGGPGTVEGRFQTELDGGDPDPQGWTTDDLTDSSPVWRGSATNASSVGDGNLEGFTGAAGNNAAISHHDGLDYVGYGNGWEDALVFTYDLLADDPEFDPDVDATSVRLLCEYKHDLEACCDFLNFEWNLGGVYQPLLAASGSSYNGVSEHYEKQDFDSDLHGGILYSTGSYIDGSKIQLRLRVSTDGGWSDADGSYDSGGRGAAAIDNIQVWVNGGLVSLADFEPSLAGPVDLPEGDFSGLDIGSGSGTQGWLPVYAGEFVGDFAKLFSDLSDLDVDQDNTTPVWTFINDGTPPNNAPSATLPPSVSENWSYGVPGGYVLPFEGGLSDGSIGLDNMIVSPPIDWDLPGGEDDVAISGVVFGYSVYMHLPRLDYKYSLWYVRSSDGSGWSEWMSSPAVYQSDTPAWENPQFDITELLVADPQQIQIRLGVLDLAPIWGVPGDATPAPWYDNVYLKKYAEPAVSAPGIPKQLMVGQNRPNPFNPRTRIEFSLPKRSEIRLTLYNVRGEKVDVLLDEVREAGPGFADWDGTDENGAAVSSGLYFYKVEAAEHEIVKKMVLLR